MSAHARPRAVSTPDHPSLFEHGDVRFSLAADSDEFYTPRRIRDALPPLDLDPCSPPHRPVQATRHIVGMHGEDGLAEPWGGIVFANPPYNRATDGSSQLEAWTAKCDAERAAGRASLVIALIPCRPSEAYWWRHVLRGHAQHAGFIEGRVKFENVAGRPSRGSGTFASVLVVWSDESAHATCALDLLRRRSAAWCHWVKL